MPEQGCYLYDTRSSIVSLPKDKNSREIYIVEGDSAAGAIRTSRDAEFQGVMPVRGKILNCLKEDLSLIHISICAPAL